MCCIGCLFAVQVLSNINSGTFAVTGKSIGLMLSPAAEKVRSPPPPILAGGAKSGASPNLAQGGRPGSAEQRLRALESHGGRGGFGAASRRYFSFARQSVPVVLKGSMTLNCAKGGKENAFHVEAII